MLPWLAEGFDNWETLPLVGYGPNDQILDDAMRERFIDSHVIRARVSQVPSSEGYLDAVRYGLGWGLIAELQAPPLPIELNVHWLIVEKHQFPVVQQRPRLESEVLEELTQSVVAASSVLRGQ